jgi:hypothetical protein
MMEITPGMLAISRAGHDKDTLYYIVKAEGGFVWLSDGVGKPIEAPKKKSLKHVQVIQRGTGAPAGTLTNEAVKRIIKLYLRKEQ